jgi:hydrogenase nickel incorporation protein HypA/HybF
MHELSIAQAVVAIAARNAGEGGRVTAVHVRVGRLRQVVPDALAFAFELSALETPVEGAELELEVVPVAGVCRDCGAEGEPAGLPLACPACGGLRLRIVRGEELVVTELEVERAETELTRSGGTSDER